MICPFIGDKIMFREHTLKTWPEFFKQIVLDKKHFEYRKNDRNFYPGDILILKEYDPSHFNDPYTGNCIKAIITGIWGGGWREIPGLADDYCIMEIKVTNFFNDKS